MSSFDLFDDDDFLDEYERWYTDFSTSMERDPKDEEIEEFQSNYLHAMSEWHKLGHMLDNREFEKEMRGKDE